MHKYLIRILLIFNVVNLSLIHGSISTLDKEPHYDISKSKLQISSIASKTSAVQLELFMPIDSAQESTLKELWYGHVQGAYNENRNYSIELGAGFRKQLNEACILGVFSYYNIPNSKNNISLLKPGIEVQGSTFGFSAQGYVPLGKNENVISKEHLYNELKGHQEIGTYHAKIESMPFGMDMIGSWKPNRHWKIWLGGYYLQYPHLPQEVLFGTLTGISYIPTPILSFDVKARVDQKQQFLLLGQINLNFGKESISDHNSNLLQFPTPQSMTPIEAKPNEKSKFQEVVKDNIYFYHPNGSNTATDCTYEQPCSTLTTQKIESMPTGATLYIATGEYNIRGKKLNLHKNQSLFGRSADFLTAAQVDQNIDQRPCINAQLSIQGKNYPTKISAIKFILDQRRVRNPQPSLVISSAENVQLNQVYFHNINRMSSPIEKAILIENSTNIQINDSSFSAFAANKIGIMVNNSEAIQAYRNIIQAEHTAINISGNSQNVQLQDNTFQHKYNALPYDVKILDIQNTVKQLMIVENKFNFGTSARDTIGMTGIDGIERTATQNQFKIKAGIKETMKTKVPNGKIVTLGKPYQDTWKNTFSVEN